MWRWSSSLLARAQLSEHVTRHSSLASWRTVGTTAVVNFHGDERQFAERRAASPGLMQSTIPTEISPLLMGSYRSRMRG
jgi:hypothetical protein